MQNGQTEKPIPGVVRLREMLADPKKTGELASNTLNKGTMHSDTFHYSRRARRIRWPDSPPSPRSWLRLPLHDRCWNFHVSPRNGRSRSSKLHRHAHERLHDRQHQPFDSRNSRCGHRLWGTYQHRANRPRIRTSWSRGPAHRGSGSGEEMRSFKRETVGEQGSVLQQVESSL